MNMKNVWIVWLFTLIGVVQPLLATDFDKAFEESKRIEQQIKRTSFPGRVYNIVDFGAKADDPTFACHEAINLQP